uniref:SET domain-containing protein n=1 Tax=Romanomermis culicivorax TaxID=13658 RepID=A0A915IIC3_ROMCU
MENRWSTQKIKWEIATLHLTFGSDRLSSSQRSELELSSLIAHITRAENNESERFNIIFNEKGRSIIASKAFKRGDFVVRYKGTLMEAKEAKRKEEAYGVEPRCYMFYFDYKGQRLCLDATTEPETTSTSHGRLINHSKRNANLIAKTISFQNTPAIILKALRDINIGEELFYDYDFSAEKISEMVLEGHELECYQEEGENRFSRCDICSKIKESYAKIHQSNDIKRSKLKEYEEWHRKMASNQRHDFHNQIQRAFAYPELEMCITTDGMDQLKLTVGFLMKGHTHSQIDQYFSRLSTYIGSSARGILTYEQFCSAVKECFKKNLEKNAVIPTIVGLENSDESMTPIISRPARMLVDAVRLRKIYALREWLIPFSNKLKNLHPYHHFWFFRDGNGKAVMKFKKWATDAYSLKNLIILNNLPQSSPLLIVPSKEKVDFIKLQQTVLKAEQVGALTKEEKEEWSNFLTNEEEYFAKYAGYELLKEEDRGIQHKRDINYCIDPDDFDIVKKLVARMSESGDQPAIPEALRQARSELETVTKDVCVEPNSNRAIQKSKEKLFKNSFLIINPDIDWCLSQSYSLLDLEEKPWLCRALTEPNEDGLITVQWYTGSVKSTWSVMKVKRQNRKGMINYTTTIDKEL